MLVALGPAVGTHEYVDDPRNADVWISIDGELFRRPDAKVSVMDAGFLLGDGVWEAFRLHEDVLVFIDDHLDRLWHGAEIIGLEIPISRDAMLARIREVVSANQMHDQVHIRLIVTRGLKPTPYQAPWVVAGPPTIVIIPEYKEANPQRAIDGISLVTVDIIRSPQNAQDPRINSLSKHNCIAGCLDAGRKGGDEGLMLDPNGNVATCNSTHFFIVKDGEVWTSTGEFCLDGITRRKILDLCEANGIPSFEKDFTTEEVRIADEAFVTGTFAGLTPVVEYDGEPMSGGRRGQMTERLQSFYIEMIRSECGG
jgi:branched-chain amino acid aminotransferase